MTKASSVIQLAQSYLGTTMGTAAHKGFIDTYNAVLPLPVGYRVTYNDDWCDAFVTFLAIKTGAVDLIGRECGVQRHIDIFKAKGIWIEDGKITPKPGDIITFNWDFGYQPNDGWADHIGIVEKVVGNQIYTIEGNTDRAVRRRTYAIGNGWIRGFARPKYSAESTTTTSPKKTALEVAKDIVDGVGNWGTGTTRVANLQKAGYNATEVQNHINSILKYQTKPADSWIPYKGGFVTNTTINLRAGASTNSNIIGKVAPGGVVRYDAYKVDTNGYYWIRQPRSNNKYGYMAVSPTVNGRATTLWGRWI